MKSSDIFGNYMASEDEMKDCTSVIVNWATNIWTPVQGSVYFINYIQVTILFAYKLTTETEQLGRGWVLMGVLRHSKKKSEQLHPPSWFPWYIHTAKLYWRPLLFGSESIAQLVLSSQSQLLHSACIMIILVQQTCPQTWITDGTAVDSTFYTICTEPLAH